ncbi:hypothetical protein HYS50_01930 [Candidatus Woesearchaeota archaeon]|nr:hypothetical protein [Candidatus Woesearchaeota archaeon]
MKKGVITILFVVLLLTGCKETLKLTKENCEKYKSVVVDACMPDTTKSGEDMMMFLQCSGENSKKFFADYTLNEIEQFQEYCKKETGFDFQKENTEKAGEWLTSFVQGFKNKENWVPEEQQTFKGEGNQKTEKVYIKNFAKDLQGGGIVRAQIKHTGTSIIVYLVDAQTDKKQQINTNTQDIVQFSMITLEKEGEYFFEIKADGKWEITLITGGYLK